MLAVDTNVLSRRVLNDDIEQAARARALFESTDQILITDIVLDETIWTLKGKRYKASPEDIAALVMSLMEEPNVIFENQQAVWSALNDFTDAPVVKCSDGVRRADFSEAPIVAKAAETMAQWSAPYEATYMFDIAAQHLRGTKAM